MPLGTVKRERAVMPQKESPSSFGKSPSKETVPPSRRGSRRVKTELGSHIKTQTQPPKPNKAQRAFYHLDIAEYYTIMANYYADSR